MPDPRPPPCYTITHMLTRAFERNPGTNLEDVLQMALRKYQSLRRKVEECPQETTKGLHLVVPIFDRC